MTNIEEQIASSLATARNTGTSYTLPDSRPALSTDEALRVQLRLGELLRDKVGGWKVSVPKGDRLIVAPIFTRGIRSSTPCPIPSSGGVARIEPEIAFVFTKRLAPRTEPYTPEELFDASEPHLALETLGVRYANPEKATHQEKMADCLSNAGLFLGPALAVQTQDKWASIPLRFEAAGQVKTLDGKHPDGHPLAPLKWLAGFLAERGMSLEPGWAVTTGSYAGVLDAPFDTPVRIGFGSLGEIEVVFSRQDAYSAVA